MSHIVIYINIPCMPSLRYSFRLSYIKLYKNLSFYELRNKSDNFHFIRIISMTLLYDN